MFALSNRLPAPRLLGGAFILAVAAVCGYAAVEPSGHLFKLVWLLVIAAVALSLSPQLFIAVTLVAFAVSTSITGIIVPTLPVPLYLSDLIVLLVAFRAFVVRRLEPPERKIDSATAVFFAAWVFVMAVAAVRAMGHGVPMASAVRGDLSVVYWICLYLGYSRILRESKLEWSSLWRYLALVAAGLAAWMFVARAINHPFHDQGLAQVPTGDNTFVNRNFGFAGAFVVYPLLAVAGVAGMAFSASHTRRWFLLAVIGVIATLLTFVRGEIFSLALAVIVILALRPRTRDESDRARTAIIVVFGVVATVAVLVAVRPTLGGAIVQRAVPFVHQSSGAELNAKYRQDAVAEGFRVAEKHPFGLGVLDLSRLQQEDIDPGFLAHSGVSTLLMFGGWPALVTALLAIALVVRRSFAVPAATPWLHPAFVGIMLVLTVYSISAAGLAGDPWVIPLGALAVAVRFHAVRPADQPE